MRLKMSPDYAPRHIGRDSRVQVRSAVLFDHFNQGRLMTHTDTTDCFDMNRRVQTADSFLQFAFNIQAAAGHTA